MTNYDDPRIWEENARHFREQAMRLREKDYERNRDRIEEYEERAKKDEGIARNMRAHQSGVRPPPSSTSTAAQAARVLREMEEDERARKQARNMRNDW